MKHVLKYLRSPYYAVNALLFLSYFIFRFCFFERRESNLLERSSRMPLTGDTGIWMTAILYLSAVWRNAETTDHFVGTAIVLFSTLIGLFLFNMECYVFFTIFVVAKVLLAALAPQPEYYQSNIKELSFEEFNHLWHGTERNAAQQAYHLVELYTTWSAECRAMSVPLVHMSVDFQRENLNFAKLNIGIYPKLARKLDIKLTSVSQTVPTFLLIRAGNVVKRLDGTVEKLTPAKVVEYFELREFEKFAESKKVKKNQ